MSASGINLRNPLSATDQLNRWIELGLVKVKNPELPFDADESERKEHCAAVRLCYRKRRDRHFEAGLTARGTVRKQAYPKIKASNMKPVGRKGKRGRK